MADKATVPPNKPAETEKPKLNPLVAAIVESANKVLDPTVPDTDPQPVVSTMTVGDIAEMEARKAQTKPEDKPAEPKPEEKPETPPADTAEPPKPPKVRKKLPEPPEQPKAPTPPQPPTPPPAVDDSAAKKKAEDEAYIAGLGEAEREAYELALFADAHGKPGIAAQTLDFFRKTDQYVAEHPDQGQDSEEFDQWIRENRPKWTDIERRKMEREMIKEEVSKSVLESPEVIETKRKIREFETKPIIDQAGAVVSEAMAVMPEKLKGESDDAYAKRIADFPPAIDQKVAQKIATDGYAAAVEEYPLEAPLVQGTLNATQEWLRLRHNLVKFNDQDPVHSWLVNFINNEGLNLARQPESAKKLPDGRTFLPMHEYESVRQANPQEAAKHWTFDDNMIAELLANNARIALKAEISRLEKAGFRRNNGKVSGDTEVKPQPPKPEEPPPRTEMGGSPRAGTSMVPGAGVVDNGAGPNVAFLESLFPGAAKAAGAA